MSPSPRLAPRSCPVCSQRLSLTRLSCDACGTELAGHFPTCEYCSLNTEDRDMLRVFLVSRGNMREVERHLGVSYPTARARFDALLVRLGHDDEAGASPAEEPRQPSLDVLDSLSKGEIDVEEALRRLG